MPTNTAPFIFVHPSNDHAAHLAQFPCTLHPELHLGFRANLHISAIFLFVLPVHIHISSHITKQQIKCCYYRYLMHSYKLNVDVSLCIHMSAMPTNNNVQSDISGARIVVIPHIAIPYHHIYFVHLSRHHLHTKGHMPTNTGPFIYVHPSNDHAAHLGTIRVHYIRSCIWVSCRFEHQRHIFIRVANIYTYHHTT